MRIGFWLWAVCCLLASCSNDSEDGGSTAAIVNVGDVAPDFTLASSDGNVVSSASLRGQAYILNFFDTRCPDCQRELEVLQQCYDSYKDEVPIINVPRSQSQGEVQQYWDTEKLSMPFYMAYDNNLYYKFANKTIPRTYVIDAEGKVNAAFDDSPTADYESLEAILLQLNPQLSKSANMSLRVRVPLLMPREQEDDPQEHFQNEYTISRLDVWFFYADTKKFFKKVVVNDLKIEEQATETKYDITYVFRNFPIQVGVYDIFVIANYENSPDDVEKEEQLLDMIDVVTYKEGIEASIPDSGPIMTNRATSLLNVDLTPWANKDYALSVDLERVLAKLQIGASENTFELKHGVRKYAEINITNYKLVNLNTLYYLFQHRDSLSELPDSRPIFVMPDNYSDYTEKGEQYVVDPFFYIKKPNVADANTFSSLYKYWFGNFSTSNFASMPPANNYGYAYVLENTMFKTAQKNGYSPGIVYKAAVSPLFVYLYDSQEKTLKAEKRPEYWPNTIYLYKHDFFGSIQAINAADNLSLDELKTYTDEELKAHNIKQCKFNMGVYETFYTYWIRHLLTPEELKGPMQYGIVRNNYYKIIVTGVSGVGNSVITPDIMRDNYPNSYIDVHIEE